MSISTKFSVNQKGSVLPILLIVLPISAGLLVFNLLRSADLKIKGTAFSPASAVSEAVKTGTKPLIEIPQISQEPKTRLYTDSDSGFQFEYPSKGYRVVADNEESYFDISKTDHRKNFTGYVGYAPPMLTKGLVLKKSDAKTDSQYDQVPLTVWVFENPNKLSIDAWFDKYWYYPFVWGIFASPGKGHIQPTEEATISGRLAKYREVSCQPNKPVFYYVAEGDRMFLLRVMKEGDGKVITQILSSFKFTK